MEKKVDWKKIKENQIKRIISRKIFETDKFLISVENIKKPLNYEIYPKRKNGEIILNEYARLYTVIDCGADHAKEVAEYHLTKFFSE